jgi:hypothetical protein
MEMGLQHGLRLGLSFLELVYLRPWHWDWIGSGFWSFDRSPFHLKIRIGNQIERADGTN